MSRRGMTILIVGVAVLVGGILPFQPWVFFQEDVVEEAFPFDDMTETQKAEYSALPDDMKDALVAMASDPDMDDAMVRATTLAIMEDDTEMDDESMEGMDDPAMVVGSGEFGQIDPIHGASGTATIYVLPDGMRVLRLEDFQSTNGPELHVLLTTGTEKKTFGNLGEYHDLGLLKGNVGNQNYDIPAEIDLDTIKSVVIYCWPFKVVFSVADLEV